MVQGPSKPSNNRPMIASEALKDNLNLLISDISILQEKLFNLHCRQLGGIQLTRAQAQLLALLATGDGLSQTQIVSQLSIEKSALASLLTNLESAGWIIRLSDNKDRRLKRVYLTDKLKQHQAGLSVVAQQSLDIALHNISQTDVEQLLATLMEVRANLDQALSN
ncbi:DNA-binding MarR family transcriptional regulator [Sinobacterium caligoides]|uniref:DNA-binding MarR family transcriptional regulator n=1 Tax=Sinobacterium caligoides TaxID=933926 RepID=A0A3N2DN17_9GAMM|nr:MarR family transcriptional regulator [Sinobacterium caligoides]ROS01160.1 DNA-binding MarR family transcriptional regulator [Sinobacterium caligoides]